MNDLIKNIESTHSIFLADEINNLERQGSEITKVHNGEPYMKTPEYIKSSLIDEVLNNNTDYCNSQGLIELREVIASYYNNLYYNNMNHKNILITPGAVNAIYISLKAILKKNDQVIIIDPSWPQYKNIAKLMDANISIISTINSNGKLTKNLIKKTINFNTKLLIINNPCNPTGIVYSRKEIDSFLEILKPFKNLFILFDEVYDKYDFSGNFCSVLNSKYYSEFKERVIYINSFSKSFSMTGWRLGYAISEPDIISNMLKISQNMFTCVPPYNQIAGMKAIKYRQNNIEIFDKMLLTLKERKNQIKNILETRKISYFDPEGAFYFFINIGKDSQKASKKYLDTDKIALVPGTSYGEDFNYYLRFCFAVSEKNYLKLINWLKKVKL